MLTETMKKDLILNIRNFLYNGSLHRGQYAKPVSTFIKTNFEKKFYEVWLYNPLLSYLEKEGVSFTWYGKICMTDHKVTERGLSRPFKSDTTYHLYQQGHVDSQNYNVKYFYTDLTSLIFSLWLLEYVVKERVASDNLVSKLMEKWAMRTWLGLQDTRRVKGTKTVWCDRSEEWQNGEHLNVCAGIQVHQNQEDLIWDGVHSPGTPPDNEPVQAI